MDDTFGTIVLVVLSLVLIYLIRHVWYLPWLDKKKEERLRNLFDQHCPQELLQVLLKYRGPDRSWSKLTSGARFVLEDIFSTKSVEAGIELLSKGETTIFIYVDGGMFQSLTVNFHQDKLSALHLSSPYRACTMLPDY